MGGMKRLLEYKMFGKPKNVLKAPKPAKKPKAEQKALVFDEAIAERPAGLDAILHDFGKRGENQSPLTGFSFGISAVEHPTVVDDKPESPGSSDEGEAAN